LNMCFNLKPISNTWYLYTPYLENPVKVFSEVISEKIDVNETLSSALQGCPKIGKSTDLSE